MILPVDTGMHDPLSGCHWESVKAHPQRPAEEAEYPEHHRADHEDPLKAHQQRRADYKQPSKQQLPRSRQRHSACCVGDCVYVFCGKDGTCGLKDVWRFHVRHQRWEMVDIHGDCLPLLQGHTALAYKRLILIFGGTFSSSPGDIQLWMYNTDLGHVREVWPEVGSAQPVCRRDHTALVHNNIMYIFGGFTDLSGASQELWAFNIDEEEWTDLSYVSHCRPSRRYGHSAVIANNAMWVFGGMSGLTPCGDLWKYNLLLHQWTKVKFVGAPPPLSGHAACVVGQQMVLIGGTSRGRMVNDVWTFLFGTSTWQKMSSTGTLPALSLHTAVLFSPQASRTEQSADRSQSTPHLKACARHQLVADRFLVRPRTSPCAVVDTCMRGARGNDRDSPLNTVGDFASISQKMENSSSFDRLDIRIDASQREPLVSESPDTVCFYDSFIPTSSTQCVDCLNCTDILHQNSPVKCSRGDGSAEDDQTDSTQGNIEDCTQGIIEDNTQGNTEDCTQGNIENNTQGNIEDNTQGNTEDCTQGNIENNTQGNIEDNTQGNTEDCTQGNIEDNTQGNIEDNTQGNTEDCTQGNIENNTQGNIEDNTQGNIEDNTQGNTEDCTQGNIEDSTQGNIEDSTQGNTEDCSKVAGTVELLDIFDSPILTSYHDRDQNTKKKQPFHNDLFLEDLETADIWSLDELKISYPSKNPFLPFPCTVSDDCNDFELQLDVGQCSSQPHSLHQQDQQCQSNRSKFYPKNIKPDSGGVRAVCGPQSLGEGEATVQFKQHSECRSFSCHKSTVSQHEKCQRCSEQEPKRDSLDVKVCCMEREGLSCVKTEGMSCLKTGLSCVKTEGMSCVEREGMSCVKTGLSCVEREGVSCVEREGMSCVDDSQTEAVWGSRANPVLVSHHAPSGNDTNTRLRWPQSLHVARGQSDTECVRREGECECWEVEVMGAPYLLVMGGCVMEQGSVHRQPIPVWKGAFS